jgi:hypothetical protein
MDERLDRHIEEGQDQRDRGTVAASENLVVDSCRRSWNVDPVE